MPKLNHQKEKVLIKNGRLIDGIGKEPVDQVPLLIADGKIVAIGRQAEQEVKGRSKQVTVIDAQGKTVMPGLIDAHVHITYGEIRSPEQYYYAGPAYGALRAAWNIPKVLWAGVTSMVEPNGVWNIGVALRDAIAAGMVEGPRMVTAGRALIPQMATGMPSVLLEAPLPLGEIVNTKDEMISAVRRQIADGVDIIKVIGSADRTTGNAVNDIEVQTLSFEELKAIADEVHRLGRKVIVHARVGSAAADAARAGVDCIFHASFLSDADLEVLVRSKVPICPTLTFLVNTVEFGKEVGSPQGFIDSCKRELDCAVKVLSEAHKSGVVFVAGSESGFEITPYGHWHARELEIFVKYLGFDPMEAILTATRNSAYLFNGGDQIGTLEAGKAADLLIVDGDPLRDITVLQDRQRLTVIKGGQLVDNTQPWPERQAPRFESVPYLSLMLLTQDKVRHPLAKAGANRPQASG